MAKSIKELEAKTDAQFELITEQLTHLANAVKILADTATKPMVSE